MLNYSSKSSATSHKGYARYYMKPLGKLEDDIIWIAIIQITNLFQFINDIYISFLLWG